MDELTRLALEARAGDRAAFTGFVRRTQADVWRLCAHLVDPAAADDLTQDTYVRAVTAIQRFRGDAPARLWLLSIARRTCADEIRGRTRRRRIADRLSGDRSMGAPVSTGPVEDRFALDELVAGLDPDRRDAFVLTQVLGLPYEDAARVVGCPVGTIRSRVSRARSDLLDALAEGTEQPGGSGTGDR